MKYEIIEKVYEIEKNSGESFQVNKIKWKGDSSRYDLRIWNENIPMQGITFTAQELKEFCSNIMQYQGVSAVSIADDEDFTTSSDLSDISLNAFLVQTNGSLKTGARVKALMKDMFPDKIREVNLVYSALECGIAKKISSLTSVSETDLHRFSNLLENQYGIKKIYAFWAIQVWADAYGVRCNTKTVLSKWAQKETPPVSEKPAPRKNAKRKKEYSAGDMLIDNEDITVIYNGIKRGLEFIFEVHNNGNEYAKLDLAGVEINDFDTRYFSFGIAVPAGKKTISEQLSINTSSAHSIGVKSIKDINSLKIKLKYKYGDKQNTVQEYNLVPVLI